MTASAGRATCTRLIRGHHDRQGLAIAVLWATVLAAVSVARAGNHWAGGLDLGLFDQAVWLFSELRWTEVSYFGGHIFEDHVSPVLLAFAPLYRIVASPIWLLIAQAAAIAATVNPIRRVARLVGAPTWLATVATVGSAPLLAAAVFDFHPLVLAAPGVAWLMVAVLEDDGWMAAAALAWVAFCRLDAAFIAVGVAVLARGTLRRRLIVAGLACAAAGLVVPHLFGDPRQTFERYYADLGDSPTDALLHPWRFLLAAIDSSSFETLFIWLLPVGFLPVLRPRWLMAVLLGGAPLLLSSWPGISMPWFHNGALLAPLVIGGALATVGSVSGRHQLHTSALLASCGLALFLQSPLSPRAPIAVRLPDVLAENGTAVDETLALVPESASVATTNQLAAPLSHRSEVYVLPCPFPELTSEDDDSGVVDICNGRRARPDIVLAESHRAAGLAELGYDVEQTPTPGIVLARRQRQQTRTITGPRPRPFVGP